MPKPAQGKPEPKHLDRVRDPVRVRHYSIRTEKAEVLKLDLDDSIRSVRAKKPERGFVLDGSRLLRLI